MMERLPDKKSPGVRPGLEAKFTNELEFTEGTMQEKDRKVNLLLRKLDKLFKRRVALLEAGMPVAMIDLDISVSIAALRMVEGKANG